jgi:hypothetical protein
MTKLTGFGMAMMVFEAGCGSAIAPRQADGQDCNYAVVAIACGEASYCDPGDDAARMRQHTYGLLGDKTHAVGTCRAKGAAGATCSRAEACLSGRCSHPGPTAPGVCE